MKKDDLVRKAQELEAKMAEIMKRTRGEATAGGGMVSALADGNGMILELKIEREVIDPQEKEMLEDLIIAAVNEARKKAQEAAKAEIEKLVGIPVPGLF
jgi:DNA-binding YbaB/EbfC family protein